MSGLGVCDVWRLELTAEQWPWLVDELEELRGPLEEALQRAYAEQVLHRTDALADEISAREYELRLVRLMRAQLPAADTTGRWSSSVRRSSSASSSAARYATSRAS